MLFLEGQSGGNQPGEVNRTRGGSILWVILGSLGSV